MQKIKFKDAREFEYDGIPAKHEAGDEVEVHEGGVEAKRRGSTSTVSSLRKDKAQRWITRSAAEIVLESKKEAKPAKSDAEAAAEKAAAERVDLMAAAEANKVKVDDKWTNAELKAAIQKALDAKPKT